MPQSIDEVRRRNRENFKKRYANDPEFRERIRTTTAEWRRARKAADPEFQAVLNEQARRYSQFTRRYGLTQRRLKQVIIHIAEEELQCQLPTTS